MKKKILIITYYWPPFGGVGVFRITKFVKYLHKLGWEISVLAPEHAETPLYDESILNDIPSDVKQYKSKIFEPFSLYRKFTAQKPKEVISTTIFITEDNNWKNRISKWIRLNLFIPDAKIGWYLYAVKKGKEIIKREKPSIILSTSPPPTTHLIARKLAKWSKIKWIADFRDPWTKIHYYDTSKINVVAKKINSHLEKKVLKKCDKITLVSNGFFPDLLKTTKTTVIPNGFDLDDISGLQKCEPNSKFTLRYLGSFKLNQDIVALFNLFQKISDDDPLRNKIKFEFYGFADPVLQKKIQDKNYEFDISFYNYVDRKSALQLISGSDMVFLVIGKSELNKTFLSVKIFDYIINQKPILAFGVLDGMANKILIESECGRMFAYNDLIAPYEYLKSAFIKWERGEPVTNTKMNRIMKYDFKNLTKLLDTELTSLLN